MSFKPLDWVKKYLIKLNTFSKGFLVISWICQFSPPSVVFNIIGTLPDICFRKPPNSPVPTIQPTLLLTKKIELKSPLTSIFLEIQLLPKSTVFKTVFLSPTIQPSCSLLKKIDFKLFDTLVSYLCQVLKSSPIFKTIPWLPTIQISSFLSTWISFKFSFIYGLLCNFE